MSITDELREYADYYSLGKDTTLHAIADRIDAELAERYVALPVDADGVPIHVGDVMEFSEFEIERPVVRTVEGIGKGVFFAWCGERGYQQHDSRRYRHHQPPTVEDILMEFHERMDELGATDQCVGTERADAVDALLRERAELVAEYAAKLRLRGEDE